MEKGFQQLGACFLRCGERVVIGRGVSKEWRPSSFDEALAMLEEMRAMDGWKLGYFSYEFGVMWQGLEPSKGDALKTPLFHFVQPESVEVFEKNELEASLSDGVEASRFSATPPVADLTFEQYAERLGVIHEHLMNGETYELNFSHMFSGSFEGNPFEVFRRLYRANPSPHACYLNFDPITVVSCSPERLISGVTEEGRLVLQTRPIKGTVPRGRDPQEDRRLIEEMLASSKHQAELNMIVDLARNDLGQICDVGSVDVDQHRVVETYSHVHHTVSNVRGILRSGLDWADVLRALFPGGSITGAPKRRTMQLIDDLEPVARGIYTGSAGYIAPTGEFDFNILIRSIAFRREMGPSEPRMNREGSESDRGRYAYHSGGGIVIDSNPQDEYDETLDKAAVLRSGLLDKIH